MIRAGGVVRAIPAPGAAAQPRSFFDKLNEWARTEGAAGLGYVVFEDDGGALSGKGPIAKFIPAAAQPALAAKAGLKAGDALFFSAGEEAKAASLAGKARVRIGDDLKLSDKERYEFCWIVDFPQYEWNEDEKKIDFSHNPFSMPAIEPTPSSPSISTTAREFFRCRRISTTWSAMVTRWPPARSATIARTS